jgi:hypothetical protein
MECRKRSNEKNAFDVVVNHPVQRTHRATANDARAAQRFESGRSSFAGRLKKEQCSSPHRYSGCILSIQTIVQPGFGRSSSSVLNSSEGEAISARAHERRCRS